MELTDHLQRREAEGCPIRVGLVGCGQMGSGMVHVTHRMAGMSTVALADVDLNRALGVYEALGHAREDIVVARSAAEAEDALRRGRVLVTDDALLLPRLEGLDCLVEATGLTEVGATVAWNAILNGKHIVMLNVETDVTVGLLLHTMAQRAGCVYTVSSGDEPGVCKGLYDFATILGFEVVCLGKGKNNPIDLEATPDALRDEAERRGMNPKMLSSFVDGTKTMVEMAAVSNATGLVPDVPGMHGPRVDLDDLTRVFVPRQDGGILGRRGCVEYSTGKVAPGVFAIVTTDAPRVRTDMRFLGMGDGPYYQLYRPYHLCNIETPLAVAEAVIYGETTVVARRLVSEVVAYAKRRLRTGEVLGDIGGPDYYGRIHTYAEARAARALPMGLALGGRVLRDVPQGRMLTEDDVAADAERLVYRLRRLQDALPEA